MAWSPFLTPIDYINLSGQRSPGIAKITAPPSTLFKWEEKTGRGASGSHLVYTGQGVAEIEVTLELYDEADFDHWDEWKVLVDKTPATKSTSSSSGGGSGILTPEKTTTVTTSKALDIWHPILADRGITSVVVAEVTPPIPSDETGVWAAKIKFKQYTPPAPSYSRTEGSDAKAGQPAQPEDDPVDREIRALTQQLADLSQ